MDRPHTLPPSVQAILIAFLLGHSVAAQTESRLTVPPWVKDAVFYQIFPERFANGDRTNDPVSVVPWGAKPTTTNYFGGDIQGIIDHIGYLRDLGIDAIYLNPVFKSSTNHKYHISDYMTIDPEFGTNELFSKFLGICHRNGIRVIIDGVFNHTGTDFFAFADIVKNGEKSKYVHWYNIYTFPVKIQQPPNYQAWWGLKDLPKLMVMNPEVKKYLFDVTRYWTKMGIDGWRLDVPNEMPHEFWIEWQKLVKSINPDCYIVGEIWDNAAPWLQGDQFDAVMNYRFRAAVLGFILSDTVPPSRFDSTLLRIRSDYPPEADYAMLNLLGSHDTERLLTLCGGDVLKMKLAVILEMTYIGAPMVYYGDEIGMKGGRDPDDRRTMIWDSTKWNTNLRDWYKDLIAIRHAHPALRHGSFRTLLADDGRGLFIYEREEGGDEVLVLVNNGTQPCDVLLKGIRGTEYEDLMDDRLYTVQGGALTIERLSGKWEMVLAKKK